MVRVGGWVCAQEVGVGVENLGGVCRGREEGRETGREGEKVRGRECEESCEYPVHFAAYSIEVGKAASR